MSIVTPYIEHLKTLDGNLEVIATDIVKQNADFIIDLLVSKQLHEGRNSAGKIVGRYTKRTEKIAKGEFRGDWDNDRSRRFSQPNQPKDQGMRYNFDWTGDWIENIHIIEKAGGFDIWSADSKAALIEQKYGEGKVGGAKLLKLTKEHNDFINMEIILPGLRKYLFHNLLRVGEVPRTIDFMQENANLPDFI